MIDRYILNAAEKDIASRFGLEDEPTIPATFNATPTDRLPIILHEKSSRLEFTYWGQSPAWSNNKKLSGKLINAPIAETDSKRSLRVALDKRRCLIPATGFVVWNQLGKKTAVPYLYHLPEYDLFSMAGIWEDSLNMDNKGYRTFRLLTRQNDKLNTISPVIIDEPNEIDWLSGANFGSSEGDNVTDNMVAYSISPVIHKSMKDSIEMIKHVPPVDQRGNYTLFG